MKLTPRLQKISNLINRGAKVVDVGTDHGYLPLYLLQNKIATRCIAADINIGPLNSAKNTFEKFGFVGNIEFRLGSGLTVLQESDDIDTGIIAGMGGETIISILEQAPSFAKKLTLVLQPMTEVEALRRYLDHNGWKIIDEVLAKEQQRFYEILKVENKQGVPGLTDKDYRFGPVLLEKKEDIFIQYLQKQYLKNKKILSFIENGVKTENKKQKLLGDIRLIEEVLREVEGTRNNPVD